MFKELFELWSEKVVAAKSVDISEFNRHKDRIVTFPDGSTKVFLADAMDRNHTAAAIETITTMIDPAGSSAVWYDRSGVIAILDEGADRRNRITMELELSPQLLRLIELERSRKAFDQAGAIKLLRLEFHDAGLGNLPDMLRRVQFTINEEGKSDLQRTKVSVGKSVLAEYHGLDGLPERINFVVPIWASKFEAVEPIAVAIEPDPTTKTFQFVPLGREIEAAIQRAEAKLGDALRSVMPENVPVLFGTP